MLLASAFSVKETKMRYLRFIYTFCLGLTFIFLQSGNAFARWGQPFGGWQMGDGWGMGGIGMVMMLAFWGLVIVALFFFIKWMMQASKGQTNNQPTGAGALDILKERYARGEIEKEEYEAKKADLNP